LPEVYATVWLNLFQLAALKPGEKVLLHAGASGIGSAAIQLCKAFGNPCWVSVGSAERLAYCEALGAQGGVVRTGDLESLSDLGPFDVILDPVGGNYAALNLKLLAQDGRWVLIGLMGGREAKLDLAQVLAKRVQLLGSTLRSRERPVQGGSVQRSTPARLAAVCRRTPEPAAGQNLSRSRMPKRRLRSWRATRWRGSWCW
jgi:NADPH:quinone reductase-like Zn-dependent oxidoreductase